MESVARENNYTNVTQNYDLESLNRKVENSSRSDRNNDELLATYVCIQNISNLMKKLHKEEA